MCGYDETTDVLIQPHTFEDRLMGTVEGSDTNKGKVVSLINNYEYSVLA